MACPRNSWGNNRDKVLSPTSERILRGSSLGMVGMFAIVLVFWWENRKGMNP